MGESGGVAKEKVAGAVASVKKAGEKIPETKKALGRIGDVAKGKVVGAVASEKKADDKRSRKGNINPVHNVPVITPTPPDDVVYNCVVESSCPDHCTSEAEHWERVRKRIKISAIQKELGNIYNLLSKSTE